MEKEASNTIVRMCHCFQMIKAGAFIIRYYNWWPKQCCNYYSFTKN